MWNWIRQYTSRPRNRVLNQKGLAAIEFALVIPVLVLLLMVLVEGANAIKTQMVLVEATREGARKVLRTGSQEGVSQLMDYLSSKLPESESAFTSYITTNNDTVTVRVTYDYQSLYFGDMLAQAFDGQTFQLEASTTMPIP